MSQKVQIESTADGSDTLYVPSMDEHYHSVNGAVQEALHVYVDAGFRQCAKTNINVLEIGFGTGLNAFLTLKETEISGKNIHYTGIELHPLSKDIIDRLNYTQTLDFNDQSIFQQLHASKWETDQKITDYFTLKKIQTDFSKLEMILDREYDIIYFDAFAPEKQQEMWSQNIFDFLYRNTSANGILTTYCAKGVVRRMLQHAGFSMERLQGPPGKREMLRAIKVL